MAIIIGIVGIIVIWIALNIAADNIRLKQHVDRICHETPFEIQQRERNKRAEFLALTPEQQEARITAEVERRWFSEIGDLRLFYGIWTALFISIPLAHPLGWPLAALLAWYHWYSLYSEAGAANITARIRRDVIKDHPEYA